MTTPIEQLGRALLGLEEDIPVWVQTEDGTLHQVVETNRVEDHDNLGQPALIITVMEAL